jgi:GntR family transcriptional regulator
MTSPPSLPLFLRVANELKERLAAGHYPIGIPLPGERALAEEFKVARVTIRSALQRLQEESLVTRLRGVGTMPVKEVSSLPHTKLQTGLLESIISFGQRSRTRLVYYGYERASEHVAQALQLPADTRILKIIRVRSVKRVPFQYTEVYLPEDVAGHISRADLSDAPVLSLIEKAGIPFARAEQELKAVHLQENEAVLLNVDSNTPVLQVRRVVFDGNDRPIQYLIGHYSSSHYQYMMSMNRTGGNTKVWITA